MKTRHSASFTELADAEHFASLLREKGLQPTVKRSAIGIWWVRWSA